MPNYVNTAANNDSLLYEYSERTLKKIVELQMPGWKKWRAMAKSVPVNQKGRSANVRHDVRTQIKFGPPNMDYPGGTAFKNIRWHAVPTEQAVTFEIDRATYVDYNKGNRDVITSISDELADLAKAFGRQKEFFLYGDGLAKLCKLDAEVSDLVMQASITPDGTHAAAYGISQLKPQVLYDLYDENDALLNDSVTIAETGLDFDNNRFTLEQTTSGTVAAGSSIVPAGSFGFAPRGLAYLFQVGAKTGFYQGIDVTGLPQFNTPGTDADGQEVSNALIEKTLQKWGFRQGTGLNPNLKIWTSPSQISTFKAPGWNMFRFAAKDANGDFNTAFKNARYEDSIFEPYPLCDPDRMYFVDGSDCGRAVQTEIGIFEGADGLRFRQKQGSNNTGKGEFFLQYGCSDQLFIDEPNKHAVMVNLSVPDDVAAIFNFLNSD